jgi:hypothetical protein
MDPASPRVPSSPWLYPCQSVDPFFSLWMLCPPVEALLSLWMLLSACGRFCQPVGAFFSIWGSSPPWVCPCQPAFGFLWMPLSACGCFRPTVGGIFQIVDTFGLRLILWACGVLLSTYGWLCQSLDVIYSLWVLLQSVGVFVSLWMLISACSWLWGAFVNLWMPLSACGYRSQPAVQNPSPAYVFDTALPARYCICQPMYVTSSLRVQIVSL